MLQVGRQCGESVVVAVRLTIFDCQILTFDVAGRFQALAERCRELLERRPRRLAPLAPTVACDNVSLRFVGREPRGR